MTTMLIAANMTRENGQFMGDQLCGLKTAYLFWENRPEGCDKLLVSLSPLNEMHFLWTKFIETTNAEVVYDTFNPGDNEERWRAWDQWRSERNIEGRPFDHYRELYLRIHVHRQVVICGEERGLGRKNIYEWWLYGQEDRGDEYAGTDCFDDSLIHHPPLTPERDVYVSPHCKTQGNAVFTFPFWTRVVELLLEAGLTVTVGYDGPFGDYLQGHPNYRKHWGDCKQWMEQVCKHRVVACGNTGTGWLAAACGVPLITMEPHNSCMADHRYRECGLRNLVEVVDGYKLDELGNDMNRVAEYTARRIVEEVRRVLVVTTGCYDVLHAGHVKHLQKSRALGTRLLVALNSDASVAALKPGRPINPFAQRRAVLEALRCVDEVVEFDGDAAELVAELRPQVLTAGFGYTEDTILGREFAERVVVTCPGDGRDEPSTTKIVAKVRSREVVEACALGALYSVNPPDKLRLLAEQLISVSHLDGDVADLGTMRGGTAMILKRLAPSKRLHCFDTWEGTPYDDPYCHHKAGEWKASYDECVERVGDAHFVKGVFPFPIPNFEDVRFCFVYVDTDTEQSVRDAVDFFWPRLVPGGKMVFDDYGWEPCAGVKRAVDALLEVRVEWPKQYTCVVTK